MKTSKSNPTSLRSLLLVGTALLLLALQVIAIIPGVTTPVEQIEYSARDLLIRMRGTHPPAPEIVIVGIDDFSFNWTGNQWPWPRQYMAEIVDQLNKGGAKVVGLDVFLFERDPAPEGDAAFARALGESKSAVSVIQIFKDTNQNISTLRRPLTPYQDVLDGMGITTLHPDEDAIVRSVQAYDAYNDKVYYHWAFELARLYLGVDPPLNSNTLSLSFNGQTIPLYEGQLPVNFAGGANTYKVYSAANVHDGITLEEDPNAFLDKIVLIGATTITLQDVYSTPFSADKRMPGVEVVANTAATIITGQYLRQAPLWMGLLITILAAVLAAYISRSQRPTLTIGVMAAFMALYLVACVVIFVIYRTIMPMVVPEVMLFLGIVLPTLEQAVTQELEKRRMRSLFNRFISPEMVDQLINTQDINSLNKRANLTVLFSDIRGFTTLSEKLSPEDVVSLLNPYLELMTGIIHKHGGTVDKYEGDAIVAFFGEPVPFQDHAARAVRTAVEMLTELSLLSEKWIKEGRVVHGFNIGIGINSGEVFVGLLGSAQRINYTVIGDNANLAARLQDLTKQYLWPIIISQSTYNQIKDEFETEFADSVVVKGKTEPVNIYKVTARIGLNKEIVQAWH
ncbi:MAG: adenylate/guanylate cyclase domain-containing protein [Anaerolineales bacterium]|nr:adenylate/guanylate cyclase domain-containing protein [Anaerolineales bacterium]